MNDKHVKICKDAIVAYLKVLSRPSFELNISWSVAVASTDSLISRHLYTFIYVIQM